MSLPPGRLSRVASTARICMGCVVDATAWVALPLALLLLLQWPLRELLQAYSREANDLAQILFAIYVSVAVTAATRDRAHLAADALVQRHSRAMRRRLARVGALGVMLPWAVFLLANAGPIVSRSVVQAEGFPETFNPGYFMIKIALALLGILVGIQALLDGVATDDDSAAPGPPQSDAA